MKLARSYVEIWNQLDDAMRRSAATAFLEGEYSGTADRIQQVEKPLAQALHFRPKTVRSMPIPKKATGLAQRLKEPSLSPFIDDVLISYLLQDKRVLIESFLNSAGIRHDQGIIHDEATKPSPDKLRKALRSILKEFPEADVWLYVSFHAAAGSHGFLGGLLEIAEEEYGPEMHSGGDEGEGIEEAMDSPVQEPESTEEFTTLDNWLIRSAVASACGEIGALSEEQLADMIEEVVDLNADRRRSHFHRGYLDGLFSRPFHFSFNGENAERRAWYFTGVMMGLLRRGVRDECLKMIRQQPDLTREVAEGQQTPCGKMLLLELYPILMESSSFQLCRSWLRHQLHRFELSRRRQMIHTVYEDAAGFVRRGNAPEALQFLELVIDHLESPHEVESDFTGFLLPKARRKLAQAHQVQGNFSLAEKVFEDLLSGPDFDQTPELLADLGLIKGGFRGLRDIRPRAKPTANQSLRESLQRGEDCFRRAVEQHGQDATNAHFALGILALLKGDRKAENAAMHLEQSLSRMLAHQRAYDQADHIISAKFCLAVALLECAEPSQFQRATDLVGQALDSEIPFPLELWERCLKAASLFDDSSLAVTIAEKLLELRGDAACQLLRSSGVLKEAPKLRDSYISCRQYMNLSPEERWKDWILILEAAISDHCPEQAETALDHLETLALENSDLRGKFIHLLSKRKKLWQPIWEEDETHHALVRLYESEGRTTDASLILERLFYRRKAVGAAHELEEARLILEEFKRLTPDHENVSLLESQLKAAQKPLAAELSPGRKVRRRLEEGAQIKLIYVGGNETQAQYEEEIRNRLGEWPGVEVHFYFPGWGAEWAGLMNELRTRIPEVDAVVLSFLVRTNFGRHVRKICDNHSPWFPCTGRGRKSIEESLRRASLWAAGKEAFAKN